MTAELKKQKKLADKKFMNREPVDPHNLCDMQLVEPEDKVAIYKVGTRGGKLPAKIANRDGTIQQTICKPSVYVSCGEDENGINMSRLDIILNENIDTVYNFETMHQVLNELRDRLGSQNSHLKLQFPFFTKKTAPVSGVESLSDHEVTFEGSLKNNAYVFTMTVKTMGMSACICSRNISDYNAHDQRSIMEIKLKFEEPHLNNPVVYIEDICEMADECFSSPMWNVLKRDDERWVTMTAYENARFSEHIARKAYNKFNELKKTHGIKAVSVVVDNEESIHQHNATSIVCDPEFAW
jgi:GTP cyclohydrolase I